MSEERKVMKIIRKLRLVTVLAIGLAFGATGVLASTAQMDTAKKTTQTVVTKTKKGTGYTVRKSKIVYAKGKHGTVVGYKKSRRGVGKAYGLTKRGVRKVYRVTKSGVVGAKKQM